MSGRRVLILLIGVAVLWTAGCGGGGAKDTPNVAKVSGTVKRKGQPIGAGVQVIYTPIKVEGTIKSPSFGITNASGRYEMQYNTETPGAMIGTHQVAILKDSGPNDADGNPIANPIIIPPQYNGKTTLEVEVPPDGLNGGAADFDLDF